jgi:hypothetical protein
MTSEEIHSRRRRGAQPGNTNALKHGFYSRHFRGLAEAELQAALSGGLDEEIAMLRLVVRQVFALAKGVEQLEQGVKLLGALGVASIRLAKLLQTQQELGGSGDQLLAALSQALGDVLGSWQPTRGLPVTPAGELP